MSYDFAPWPVDGTLPFRKWLSWQEARWSNVSKRSTGIIGRHRVRHGRRLVQSELKVFKNSWPPFGSGKKINQNCVYSGQIGQADDPRVKLLNISDRQHHQLELSKHHRSNPAHSGTFGCGKVAKSVSLDIYTKNLVFALKIPTKNSISNFDQFLPTHAPEFCGRFETHRQREF